ncbi:MAG TPA: hypothetical protein VGN37_16865 [Actinocatenispora sp.]
MEAAATDGAGGPSGDPWERAVRAITLAARADVLEHMADRWSAYTDTVSHYADKVAKVWDILEPSWAGPAADTFHRRLNQLAEDIANVHDNYAAASSVLTASASAVKDAIHAIPIPIFTGGNLPGGAGKGALDGPALYDDYQNDRGNYADYAFRDAALAEGNDVQGVRDGRKGGAYAERNTANDPALHTRHDATYKAAIDNWYGENQNTANIAQSHLVKVYADAGHHIPKAVLYEPSQPEGRHPASPPGTAGTSAGGSNGGGEPPSVGALPRTDGGSLTARSLPHALPPHAVLGPPETRYGGSSDADSPGGTALTAAPGAAPTGMEGALPITRGGPGGSGVGAAAIGGSVVGGGIGSVPATTVPSDGWWDRPATTPTGPGAPSPAALKLGGSAPGRGGAGMPGGLGMMPATGHGTKATANEDYTTWLKEDDDEIWGPRWEDQPTGLVE